MSKQEIREVKSILDASKTGGEIIDWELPYESLLTRLPAALFFVQPKDGSSIDGLATALSRFPDFSYTDKHNGKLSKLKYKITFTPQAE